MAKYGFAAVAFALALVPAVASAQYPNHAIKLVVPALPGGSADIVGRLIQPSVQSSLKQPVVVENKGGAGGYLGTEQVAKSPPDGYTLAIGGAFSTITTTLRKSPNYNPRTDLVPVAIIATVPTALVAGPKLKATTVAELIAEAKANPGRVNMGSNGVGSTLHLSGELFKIRTGAKIEHVAYRGWAESAKAVADDEVDFMFDNISSATLSAQAGKVRLLAVAAPERHWSAPEVPTLAELGVKDADVISWYGVLAPAGTPQPVIETLDRAFKALAESAEFKKQIQSVGMDAHYIGAAEARTFWNAEIDKWTSVIKTAGITQD